MKINFDDHRAKRSKRDALHSVNYATRSAREKIMSELMSPEQIRLFLAKLNEARYVVLREMNIDVPVWVNVDDKRSRDEFIHSLPDDVQYQWARKISAAIKAIAAKYGFTHLSELENTKTLQLDGAEMSECDEDVRAVVQMTNESHDATFIKHRDQKHADRRLSNNNSAGGNPAQETPKPKTK